MTIMLSDDQLRHLRVRAQGLGPHTEATSVADIVGRVVGLQAQDPTAAALGLRARGSVAGLAAVERALVEDRSIVRTWALRGTLHLLAAADCGWLVALVGPSALAGARRRHSDLGLDDQTAAEGVRLLQETLAQRGPMTRAELAIALAPHGLPTAGQALYRLLWRAALEGVICLGPVRDQESTYVLADAWVSPTAHPDRDQALGELARRYLTAYGPATVDDFVVWSGLPVRDARRGWDLMAGDLLQAMSGHGPVWLLASHASRLNDQDVALGVRLLPAFDTLLLGYRSRALIVDPEDARRVHPGGGIIRPVVLLDGRAIGVWRSERRRSRLTVVVEPFASDALASAMVAGLEAEVAAIGEFLALPATLHVHSLASRRQSA